MARPRLCRRKLPLSKPSRGAWRFCRSQAQFLCQPSQVFNNVNVVKRSGEAYGKLQNSYARQKSLQCAAGAHSIACEKRRMRSLCPDKIVASVVGWSYDQVMSGQCFERVLENRTGQVWAIAVEGNDATLVISREMPKHGSEARGQTFTLLRKHGCFVACKIRQVSYIRFGAHDGDFDVAQ